MWPTVDYLRAMFDESPAVPPIAEDDRPYLASPVGKCDASGTVDMDSPRLDLGINDDAGVR
jgi:hypothetical protein